jgi:hypothetical protein
MSVGVVPKNNVALRTLYPKNVVRKVRVPFLTKGVFVSDRSPDIGSFSLSPFDVFDFIVRAAPLHHRIHDKVMVWRENTKDGTRRFKRWEHIIGEQRKLQNIRFGCVLNFMSRSLSTGGFYSSSQPTRLTVPIGQVAFTLWELTLPMLPPRAAPIARQSCAGSPLRVPALPPLRWSLRRRWLPARFP